MVEIRVKVKGFEAEIEYSENLRYIEHALRTIKKVTMIYKIDDRRVFQRSIKEVPLYKVNKGTSSISTTLGIIKHLEKTTDTDIKYEFLDNEEEYKTKVDSLEIPEKIKNSPKFTVSGKTRYYFFECLESCLSEICGLVRLPTGSGKTEIELTLAHNLVRLLNGRGIIIVPTTTIMSQTYERALSYDIKAGLYKDFRKELSGQSGNLIPEDLNIFVSTPMVLFNDISKGCPPKDIKWVITDESHHTKASTWLGVIFGLKDLRRIYGFSATPLESYSQNFDFRTLGYENSLCVLASGPLIYSKDAKSLEGFVSIPKLVSVEFYWKKEEISMIIEDDGFQTSEYSKVLDACQNNKRRISYIADILKILCEKERNCILYTHRKAVGYKILSECRGYPVVVWYADDQRTSGDIVIDQQWIRTNFGTERCRAIIASSHATEGLDIKNPIDCVFLIDGEGDILTIQRVGRATRLAEKTPIVINLQDHGVKMLERHSKKRKSLILNSFGIGEKEEFHFKTLDLLSSCEII